jgi:hypothetical protein
LLVGVELVRDRKTREPAVAEARRVVNRMRDLGVLTATEGSATGVPADKAAAVTGPIKKASGHAMRESPARRHVTDPAKDAKRSPRTMSLMEFSRFRRMTAHQA